MARIFFNKKRDGESKSEEEHILQWIGALSKGLEELIQ